jgi:signal transduction histidine kinase/ligand-binding sensor domain-containing protein
VGAMGKTQGQGRSAVALAVVLIGMLLMWCPCAMALDPSLDVSQYAHTSWRIRDGFTKGTILAIAQTHDGYLWLGTEFGLVRFDGVRAVPWQPPNGAPLPSNNIRVLLVGRDGTLWIATLKGLASWKDGKLTNYPEVPGQISTLLQDREGTVWFGVLPPGKLCAIQGGKVQCYGAGSLGQWANGLYEDHKGSLWVSAQTGVWRWAPGTPEQYAFTRPLLWVSSVIEDDSGTLLVPTVDGVKRLAGGKIQSYALPGGAGHFRPNRFFRSSDGSLWGATEEGLLHVHQGRTDVFGAADGLSGDLVNSIFEDLEGNVWVSTTDGLDLFREYAVPGISRKQGLANSEVWAVQATSDGSIWIGGSTGLDRWRNENVTIYGGRNAPGRSGEKNEQERSGGGAATQIADSGLSGDVRSLGQDDLGRLWVSTSNGVFYFETGRFVRVTGVADINAWSIAGDDHGKMWISGGTERLFSLTSGGALQSIPWSQFGQKNFWARALLADRLQGGVWLGFYDGGIAYFKDGQVRASYSAADGVGNGRVNGLRFGSRGTLWAATEGGLSRIRDGHVETLTSKNGLPCDEVHRSVEDDDHFVWVYMPCGLARIARSELDAWVSDPSRKLQLTMFDSSDGVRSIGVYGSWGPYVTKSPDGKIWFLSQDGVSVIDSRHLPFNKLSPPVYVEQITADRKTYDASSSANGRVSLPARIRDLEIDYTALSLVAPEKNRFRVKLEGWDRDWQDVGNRRQAFYTNLSPGNYGFRVTASNNSGVWNEAGTFLDFSIAPAYYQTNWFRVTCVAGFLVSLWALYRLRLRQMARQFTVRMEERVGERTRIARDLHDTLLQSFHGLLLRFQTVSHLLPAGDAKQRLDSAIDQAAQAITEGRDAVQGLRSSTVVTNELAVAVSALGEALAADHTSQNSAVFHVEVEGTPRNLHPILRDEVYRIAGEALRNAFGHAQARHIEVEIRYDERQLRLRVRDDGKSIDPKVLSGDGRAGHFGLHGIRERAKLIGGKLAVWSELDSGTEVELSIPASNAYDKSPATRRSWLTEKLSGKFSGKDTAMKS